MIDKSAKVVATGKSRYVRRDVRPVHEPADENCTCQHGGEELEDHTPGVGCERRGCGCLYWSTEEI